MKSNVMKEFNILIVEGDLMIGDLLQKILHLEAYYACWKTDGREVLDN